MHEKMPVPGQYGKEQNELFDEDELMDPDKDLGEVLEFIKESEARLRRAQREREKKRKKAAEK